MQNKKERVLFAREDIAYRIREMGIEISEYYKGNEIVVISLLRGSFIFTSDLVREIKSPVEVDFMTTASYGDEEVSSGMVNILQDIRTDIKNRDVLIVDDIIDTGNTLSKVIEHLSKKQPKSIKICVMLDKPSRRKVDLQPDFSGFVIPDVFIVGYGLNYGNYYRNIPYIFTFE
ncbi:hypoxanthine phosphoribosyltransferase [Soehngenia longivitae]|uniref:Hypoxanthine phosphoribosyltransferase n=1 Tax=Soehngenia longivitae TaxID=2562294 RepID=A0A4Z0D5Y3_9FIRM|nr:hypoxanthine phosphoribosyltransferase [Soehngenia longivitae]TFZ40288.1 hypoxanthine phosphoribosyltransferase [Soehngenia longivitae]